MPLTDEEAIALAVLDGMEWIGMPHSHPTNIVRVALTWPLYKDAPASLRGAFTLEELAQEWCKHRGLS